MVSAGFCDHEAIKRHWQQQRREILCIISIYTHPLSIILKLYKFETWRYSIMYPPPHSQQLQTLPPSARVIQHTYTPTRGSNRCKRAAAMKVKSRGTYYSYHLSKQRNSSQKSSGQNAESAFGENNTKGRLCGRVCFTLARLILFACII